MHGSGNFENKNGSTINVFLLIILKDWRDCID